MHLPAFWRRASFAVAEAAELLGVPEVTLRTWMARTPFNDFIGMKRGFRVFLSGQDIWHYLIVRELTRYGVPVRTAMLQANLLANETTEHLPANDLLVVRRVSAVVTEFERVAVADTSSTGALVLPMRVLAEDLIARAAVIYLTEAS